MTDVIGSAHMIQGSLTSFTLDRFGNPNSALALNGGYTQVPSGIYFDTPAFIISAWVYPATSGWWARLIDFGNGYNLDNVIVSIDTGFNQKPCLEFYDSIGWLGLAISSQILTIGQWQLLTTTFDGTYMSVFINSILTVKNPISFNRPINATKTLNFVGKSNTITDGYSASFIDDLKFYSIALSESEINAVFLQSGSYQIGASTKSFLTNYWPISNVLLCDLMNGNEMNLSSSVLFTTNRFK